MIKAMVNMTVPTIKRGYIQMNLRHEHTFFNWFCPNYIGYNLITYIRIRKAKIERK